MERPVGGAAALDVARADDGVGAGFDRGEHGREHLGSWQRSASIDTITSYPPSRARRNRRDRRCRDPPCRVARRRWIARVGQRSLHERRRCHLGCCRRRRGRRRRAPRRAPAAEVVRRFALVVGRQDDQHPHGAASILLAPRPADLVTRRPSEPERRSAPRSACAPIPAPPPQPVAIAGSSRSTSASVGRAAPAATSTPDRPSMTVLRWPWMSVATAGVPHAAPSVKRGPIPRPATRSSTPMRADTCRSDRDSDDRRDRSTRMPRGRRPAPASRQRAVRRRRGAAQIGHRARASMAA